MRLPQQPNAFRPHLSQSRVLDYLSCGWRYFLRHVERRFSGKSAALAFGRAAHLTAAADLWHKKDHGSDFDFDHIRDVFRSNLAAEIEDVELRPSEVSEFVNRARAQDRMRGRGDLVFEKFLAETAPGITPVAIEETVRVETTAGFDLVVIPDVREPDSIGDLKFGRSPLDADDSLQLTVEAIAFAAKNGGRYPDSVYFERYKPGDKQAGRERIDSKRGPKDAAAAAQLFEHVANGIDRDIFLPTGRASSWLCRMCEFGPNGDQFCIFAARDDR
jgi:hypothetical protein